MNRNDPRHPLARLRHHVTGAVERGEKEPVVNVPAKPVDDDPLPPTYRVLTILQ